MEAIAAAAIVASCLPGGTAIDTPFAPDFLLEGGTAEVADDVPAIAVRALDRIVATDSGVARIVGGDRGVLSAGTRFGCLCLRATLDQATNR